MPRVSVFERDIICLLNPSLVKGTVSRCENKGRRPVYGWTRLGIYRMRGGDGEINWCVGRAEK